jgi:hypothetical protein
MTAVTGGGNGEEEAMGCDCFHRARGGGGEVAPRCRRRATHRRVARQSGRPMAATSV